MRLFDRVNEFSQYIWERIREFLQHILEIEQLRSESRHEFEQLRAEADALRYLVKLLLTGMLSGEPKQAIQEVQELIATTYYVKTKAVDEDNKDMGDHLTETARAKALEVIEAVRSAVLR